MGTSYTSVVRDQQSTINNISFGQILFENFRTLLPNVFLSESVESNLWKLLL